MPLRTGEAFILRTYSFKESDRIVSFFTREFGKRRGVARGSRRPKSKFGATLEPLTEVRIRFFEREGRELSTVDECELVASPLAGQGHDLLHSVAVSLMAEVADRLLPDSEVSDATFRLLGVATAALREAPAGEAAWLPLTYYLYWMVRLGGFLPPLETGAEAQALAAQLAKQPLSALEDQRGAAAGEAGRQLRQRLKACLEEHIEATLRAWPMLADMEGDADISRTD